MGVAQFKTCIMLPWLVWLAQWIEHQPINQRATGLILSQGTWLGCGPGPQWGPHKIQAPIDVSLSPSLSLSDNK